MQNEIQSLPPLRGIQGNTVLQAHLAAKIAQVLIQVVGKAVVIVNEQSGHLQGHSRKTKIKIRKKSLHCRRFQDPKKCKK